tara:strand:+ start:232 stop:393 length:162 start_codon:yes stop_codon:yes gene_type:complete
LLFVQYFSSSGTTDNGSKPPITMPNAALFKLGQAMQQQNLLQYEQGQLRLCQQ